MKIRTVTMSSTHANNRSQLERSTMTSQQKKTLQGVNAVGAIIVILVKHCTYLSIAFVIANENHAMLIIGNFAAFVTLTNQVRLILRGAA